MLPVSFVLPACTDFQPVRTRRFPNQPLVPPFKDNYAHYRIRTLGYVIRLYEFRQDEGRVDSSAPGLVRVHARAELAVVIFLILRSSMLASYDCYGTEVVIRRTISFSAACPTTARSSRLSMCLHRSMLRGLKGLGPGVIILFPDAVVYVGAICK